MPVRRMFGAPAAVALGLALLPVHVHAAPGGGGAGEAGGTAAQGYAATVTTGYGTDAREPGTREAPAGPSARASLGNVSATVDGEPVTEPPIAPCSTGGVRDANTRGVTVDGIAEWGRGQTACRSNDNGTATAQTSGRRFVLDALAEHGGPRIRLRTYSSSCSTTGSGSEGRMQVRGVSGVDVPEHIPSNHTVTIPGPEDGDPPLAEVVLNEVITPDPPTGELTLNVMRVRMFPESGKTPSAGEASDVRGVSNAGDVRGAPLDGDVVVGSVTCNPFS